MANINDGGSYSGGANSVTKKADITTAAKEIVAWDGTDFVIGGSGGLKYDDVALSDWQRDSSGTINSLHPKTTADHVSIGDKTAEGGLVTDSTLFVNRYGTNSTGGTPMTAQLMVQTLWTSGSTPEADGTNNAVVQIRSEQKGDSVIILADKDSTGTDLIHANIDDVFTLNNSEGDSIYSSAGHINFQAIDSKDFLFNNNMKQSKLLFYGDDAWDSPGILLTVDPREFYGVQISNDADDDSGVPANKNLFEVNSLTQPSRPWPSMTSAQVATSKITEGGAIFDSTVNRLKVSLHDSDDTWSTVDIMEANTVFVNPVYGDDEHDGRSPGAAVKTIGEAFTKAGTLHDEIGAEAKIALASGHEYETTSVHSLTYSVHITTNDGGRASIINSNSSGNGDKLINVNGNTAGRTFRATNIDFYNQFGPCLVIERTGNAKIHNCGFYQIDWDVTEDDTAGDDVHGSFRSAALSIMCSNDGIVTFPIGSRPSRYPVEVTNCYFYRSRKGATHSGTDLLASRYGQSLIRVDSHQEAYTKLCNVNVQGCTALEVPATDWNVASSNTVCPGFLSVWPGTGAGAGNSMLGTESYNMPTVNSSGNTYTIDFSNIGDNKKSTCSLYVQEWAMHRQADDWNSIGFERAKTVITSNGDTFNPIWEGWDDTSTAFVSKCTVSFMKFVWERQETLENFTRTHINGAAVHVGGNASGATDTNSYGIRAGYCTWISTKDVEQETGGDEHRIQVLLASSSWSGVGPDTDTINNENQYSRRNTVVDTDRWINPFRGYYTNILANNVSTDGRRTWLCANGETDFGRPIAGEIKATGNAGTRGRFQINMVGGPYTLAALNNYEVKALSSATFQWRARITTGTWGSWSTALTVTSFYNLSGFGYEDGYRFLDGTSTGTAVGGIRIRFTASTVTMGDQWAFSGNVVTYLEKQRVTVHSLNMDGGALHDVGLLNFSGTPHINMGDNADGSITGGADRNKLLFTGAWSSIETTGDNSYAAFPEIRMLNNTDFIHVNGSTRNLGTGDEPAISTFGTIGGEQFVQRFKNGNTMDDLDKGEPVKAMLGSGFNAAYSVSDVHEARNIVGNQYDSEYFIGISVADVDGSPTWGYGWAYTQGYVEDCLVVGFAGTTGYGGDLETWNGYLKMDTSGSANYHTVAFQMERFTSTSVTLRPVWLVGPATTTVES